MNPCSANRKRLAWLAVDALDPQEAAALRGHLARCEGCRRYAAEITHVTRILASAESHSNREASESFHHQVGRKLKDVESTLVLENLAAWVRCSMPSWRVALPGTAFVLVLVLAMLMPRKDAGTSRTAPPMFQLALKPQDPSALPPTIANYQRIASRSLEELDQILTQQGHQPLPPAPLFTPSGPSSVFDRPSEQQPGARSYFNL